MLDWGDAMNLILWLLYWIIGSTVFLWAFYAVITPLDSWAASKSGTVKGVVMSISNAFWIADYLYNLTTGSLIFWEFVQESPETFSARLRRHYYGPYGWRRTLASWFRFNVNNINEGHI